MNREIYLPIVKQAMEECAIGCQVIQENPGTIRLLIDRSDVERLSAVWSWMARVLTSNSTIEGVHSIPFESEEDYGVIWIDEFPIIFLTDESMALSELVRPTMIPPVIIAIGGASCSGKTSIANKLKELMPGRVLTYPAYTTRPRRPSEVEGLEYFFKTDQDLTEARLLPHFSGFVEARGFWYWLDASRQLRGAWEYPDSVHLFLISQPDTFLRKRAFFPGLKWIWIDVSDEVLRKRLLKNLDRDFEGSMRYNAKLRSQDRTGLVDLVVSNEDKNLDRVAGEVCDYVEDLLQRRSLLREDT